MAIVYLATLRGAGGFEKRLVVKQIRAELANDAAFVERFVAEAKTTVGLSHPNIVPVYELGVEQGVYFIAMELAQGVTLADLLPASGRLSPEEGAYLGVETCRALDYAHRKAGIVHRDVTPRNVLVDEEGAVRLIDFGIAAPATVEGAARERVFGSPGHMPIEQLRGGRLTPATDVFAVGALLIEAWTGRAPFRRAAREESDAALSAPLPPLSLTEPRLAPLDALLARAVAFDAEERPQTPEELARPLREFLRSADLGDIARRLGQRVRAARRVSVPKLNNDVSALLTPQGTPVIGHKSSSSGDGPGTRPITSGQRPSVPPAQTSVTRPIAPSIITETFAARDEVVEWARRASERPPGLPSPSPQGIDTSDLDKPKRRGPLVATLLVVSVGAVAALAVFVPKVSSTGDAKEPPAHVASVVPPALSTQATPTSPIPTGASAEPSVVASRPTAAPPLPRPPHDGASTGAPSALTPPSLSSSAESTEESRVATLTVTADLAARVTIDGSSFGVTPIRGLKRSPGRHVVTLVSVELDERLRTTIDPKPGQTISIHAEFTRPVPALRVR
jgi:serine/threonine-protein kinase